MNRFWDNNDSVRIKICGIESLEYAYDIYELGVHAVGYHLWKHEINTPEFERKIKIFEKLSSYLPNDMSKFLLTNVSDLRVINDIIKKVDFDTLQLHLYVDFNTLRETFMFVKNLKEDLRLVSVVSLNEKEYLGDIITLAQQYDSISDAVLVDSSWKGGSGKQNNWILAKTINDKIQGKLILAGGIKPINIKKANEIVNPYALDIQSAAERLIYVNDREIKLKSTIYTSKLLNALTSK
jgi:phosphoribosylanthranilate isomerase